MTGTLGWRHLSLEEIAAGGLFTDGDWVESKDQDPAGPVRLTQLADVGDGVFRDRSNRWLREDQASRLSCSFLLPDDILIARMPDPLGRACLVPANLGRAVTVVDVAVLRIARGDMDARYVMWAINAPRFRRQIEALQSGTTRKRISHRKLAALRLAIPPIDEQRHIVDVLEDHLSRLDVADASIRDLPTALAALRLSTLVGGRERLLCNDAPVRRLGDVATTALGKMLDSKKAKGSPTPYLRNINVRWGEVDLRDVQSVPLTDDERARFALQDSDLLVCEGGEPGRCAVWTGDEALMTYQKALHRVRIKEESELDVRFVALMLEEAVRSGRVASMLTGTTIKHLPQEKLREIQLPIPSMAEQRGVLDSTLDLDRESARLAAELKRAVSKGRALRQALLLAAFSNRLIGNPSSVEAIEELSDV